MKALIIFRGLVGIFLLGFIPICAMASQSEGNPACGISIEFMKLAKPNFDTIPGTAKPAESTTTKPVEEKPVVTVIKQVPKARKVSVPRQVTVKVRPVKAIKPKIIKPVIKL